MDPKQILRAFNNHFVEFMDDIKLAFPKNKDISAAYFGLKALKSANPKLVCSIWNNNILKYYRDSIEKGDIEYFANKDYNDDFAPAWKHIVKKLDNFRKPLIELPDSEKEKVIKYLQNLTKLNDLYFKLTNT